MEPDQKQKIDELRLKIDQIYDEQLELFAQKLISQKGKEIDPKLFDELKFRLKKPIEIRKILTGESDRGCALLAASYLDSLLSDLLFLNFVEDKRIEKELFEVNGPLSTYSSKINMSYYLGKISRSCRDELHLIRKIRNIFGHDPDIHSFEEQSIVDLCKNLKYSYHENASASRNHFTASVLGITSIIMQVTFLSTAPNKCELEPPNEQTKERFREQLAKTMDELEEEHL